ncbi:MAG TPA: NAD-dependent epimerase/dehydratase family protein [Thermoanaerobaculia bacterium]|jgi:UDP-glucose 4-epimerase
MARVVVTGGAGFLGRHIVRALSEAGVEVCVLDRLPPRDAFPPGVEVVAGNVAERDVVERTLCGADAVVHLACTTVPQTSEDNRLHDLRSNVEPALTLLDCAAAAGARRFVFASSGGTIYGNPIRTPIGEDHPTRPANSHGAMKLAVEGYLWSCANLTGLETYALRMSNAYGPGQTAAKPQGFIGVLARMVRSGKPVEIWGDGSVVRDFVFVEDVARAFVQCLAGSAPPGPYNIGSGLGHSLREVVALAEKVLGASIPVHFLPSRRIDVPSNVLDVSRARTLLGWEAQTPLEEGLRKTLIPTAG